MSSRASKRLKTPEQQEQDEKIARFLRSKPHPRLHYDITTRIGRRLRATPAAGIGFCLTGIEHSAFAAITANFVHSDANGQQYKHVLAKHRKSGQTTASVGAPAHDALCQKDERELW